MEAALEVVYHRAVLTVLGNHVTCSISLASMFGSGGYLIQVRPMRLTLEFWPELLGKRPSLSTGVVSKKSAWTFNGYLCHHLGKIS